MQLKQIIISSIVLLALDFIYLSTFSGFFNSVVKKVQGENIKFNIWGGILCYILIIYGLNYFILDQKKSIKDAFLLGFITYGIYETTNYAILKNWPFNSVVLDTLWGGILYASATFLTRSLLSL
jgi:uncharacterized membrane protein